MVYNPTYIRNPRGAYSAQKQYVGILAGSDAYITEDEFNEFQAILNERITFIAEFFSSGSLTKGTDSVASGIVSVQPRHLLLNGWRVLFSGKAADSSAVKVTLPAGPGSGTRTDLVYVVGTLKTLNYQAVLYNNGYLRGDTLTNDMFDTRLNVGETSRRIQLQWDVVASSGATSLSTLGFTATTYDSGLYTRANANAVDGLDYAIPLYQVLRTFGGADALTDISSVQLKTALASNLALTGINTAPTATPGTNSNQLATTAYADYIASLKANSASPTFTGVVTLAQDPVSNLQAATKQYVDAYVLGLETKLSVRAVATANITLSGTQTIDGVALVVGNRVLVMGQTTASQNGIYVVSATAWTRSSDADTSAKVTSGMYTWAEEGTANGLNGYTLITPNPITLGTTALTFSLFNGPGSVTVGANLTKSGNQISLATNVALQGEMDAGAHTIGFTELDNGASGAAKTIDFRVSNKQKISVSASTTLTFVAPTKPCNLTLKLTYAGAFTVTLPTHKRPGGTALVFTSVTNAVDILSIYWDGTSYFIMNSLNWS